MTQDAELQTFVDGVTDILGRTSDEVEIVDAVAERLRALLAGPFSLRAPYMAPHPERYVMYPLYIAPDNSFCVASAVWGVGQSTPLHDHQVWGVVGIVSGVEHEERFEPCADGAPLAAIESLDLDPGEVTVCCTTDRDIHRVSCGSPTPCVGIHVYGGNIWEIRRRSYDANTGRVSWFTSSLPDIEPALSAGGGRS